MENDPSPKYFGRWVVFPMFVESCGSVTRTEYTAGGPGSPCGSGCTPHDEPATCSGTPETIGNICSYVPYKIDGKAQAFYAWRKFIYWLLGPELGRYNKH